MAKQVAAVLDSLEGVAEADQELYTEAQDGKFVLNIGGRPRGFVPAAEHEEFRTNNNNLTNDLKSANERLAGYDGIDPTEARELLNAKSELDKANLIKKGDMEGLVSAEVAKALEPMTAENAQLKADNQEKTQQLASKVVDEEIIKAGNAFGKMKAGTEDVLVAKAKQAGFQNVNGELRQVQGDQTQYSVENPGQPMTISEWITTDASKAFSWVWEPSSGGGGSGTEDVDPGTAGPGKIIKFEDRKAFRANLEDIASGKTVVAGPRK